MVTFIKAYYVCNASYPVATTFIKLAILFQYLRVFGRQYVKLRIFTIGMIVFISMWGFAFSFLTWVPCIPVNAFWDWTIPEKDVLRYGYGSHNRTIFVTTFLTHLSSNLALDLIIYAIPIPLWFDAGLRGKSRLGLFVLFVLGAA